MKNNTITKIYRGLTTPNEVDYTLWDDLNPNGGLKKFNKDTKTWEMIAESPKDGLATKGDIAQLAGDVKDTTEKAGASSLAELNARLLALEKIVSNSLHSKIEVTKEFNVWGKTNLILYGDEANTEAPDFIGQKYIDTTNSNVYVAVGTNNAGNWKLV